MNRRLVEIDGMIRPLEDWARQYGIDSVLVNERLRNGWDIRRAIVTPSRKYGKGAAQLEEHDTEVDTLCESGEPDRRATVYGMVVCGSSNERIAKDTGIDPAEVAAYRADCPEWWGRHMGQRWDYTSNTRGVG